MEYEIALRHHTHGEGANKIMRRTYMIKTDGQMTCNKKDSITKLGMTMTMTEWRWREGEAYCYTRNRITMGRYSVGKRNNDNHVPARSSGSLDTELEHDEY